jgi:hypothetical protein
VALVEGGIQMFTFSSKSLQKKRRKCGASVTILFYATTLYNLHYLFFPHFIQFHWGMHSSERMAWKHQLSWDVFLFQLHEKQQGIVGTCRDCPQMRVANEVGEMNQRTTTSLCTKQNLSL